MTRRTGPAGALALAALVVAGCGQGSGDARVETASPSAFVAAVRELVAPAERLGVLASSALDQGAAQPSRAEIDGVVDDAARELREFRAMRLGDAALRAEQARLADAMRPIVARMREIRAILDSDSRTGLRAPTQALLDALEAIPSAARS